VTLIGGGFAAGPASSMRFAGQTRGRINGSYTQGVNYPSPFFDVAHTWLPVTIKQLFKWCRYYFLTNPLINATVFKLSEYPVTDLIIDHENPEVVKMWTDYMQDKLRFRPFQIECGLDYHCYGNSMVSIAYPFVKYIACQKCGFSEQARKIRKYWTHTNFTFRLACPKCGTIGDARAHDQYLRNASGIKLIRWNCEHVEVQYNDVTGESTYYYTIPSSIRNDIVIGKKDVVEGIPNVFIQAMRENKGVVFSKSNFFHMKRPTLAQQDRGWGIPLELPVLKDTFYLTLMKKAQEAILLEHVVPLRILFPQAGSGTSDPYTTINLGEWKDHVASEIARWRHDPNYIPILPLPIGNETIGGDGRALLLTQEIQAWSEHIMVGMGVPKEFLLGGLSYSGTNVSMRMLENAFLGYIMRQRQMAKWIMKEVAAYLGWPEVDIRFKPFKMADDIQRKAYLIQLNQLGKISDQSLLADADFDQEEEDKIKESELERRLSITKKEQIEMAKVQGESQEILGLAQAKAQQAMQEAAMAPQAPGEPGGPEAGGGVPGGQQAGAAPPGPMEQMQSPLGAGQQMGFQPAPGSMAAQAQPAQPGQPGQDQMGVDINQMAQMLAQQYVQMEQDEQQLAMQNLQLQSPELAQLVMQYLRQQNQQQQAQPQQPSMGIPGGGPQMPGVDMRPAPDQLPARRESPMV